jgi:hypothetical protein
VPTMKSSAGQRNSFQKVGTPDRAIFGKIEPVRDRNSWPSLKWLEKG